MLMLMLMPRTSMLCVLLPSLVVIALARKPLVLSSLQKDFLSKPDVIFLPKTLKPVYYDIEIRPNMYKGDPSTFTFDGFTKIVMDCEKTTSDVIIHLVDLDITSGSIEFGTTEGEVDPPKYQSHDLDPDSQVVKIKLDKAVTVGKQYYVQMNYTALLSDDLRGFYLSSYDRDGQTVYLATTQFESTDARRAFPCFDEPEMKAKFNVILVRKKEGIITMSNMNIVSTHDREPGFVADIYETTPVMSTYLLAFIVSDFQFIQGKTSRGLEYRVWAQAEALDKLEYSLDVGTKTIVFYEDYFNIPYPLPKQDMVAIPDFAAGAMENWGLITYRAVMLFYTRGVTSQAAQQSVVRVITHELAHQWFGNLVTMKWWSDLWLNEGFATFFSYVAGAVLEPDWKFYDQFVVDEILPAFNFDGRVTSHPVFVKVETPNEIQQIFDTISYNKGGSILRMLRFFIGEGTFQRGLTRYLKSKEYSNADHDDLWKALSLQAEADHKHVEVADTMATWTLQMNYPVVSVSRVGQKELRLTQSRFLFNQDAKDMEKYSSPYDYTWNIPFTFTTSKQKNFDPTESDVLWMMRNDTSDVYTTAVDIPDPSDESSWILGNIRHHGFYRVNYDEANWRNIIKQLKTDHKVIIPINRAQIINDALDLASAEMLDQSLALQTLEYLSAELSYFPWVTARGKLIYMDTMIRDTEVFPAFQEFMRTSSAAAYQHYGLGEVQKGHVDALAQRQVAKVACDYFNEACTREAQQLFREWRKNPKDTKINPEVFFTVVCVGIWDGVADDWFFLYDKYHAETSLSLKSDMLRALTCSQEPDIIQTLLERALQPSEIPRQDATSLIASFPSTNPTSQPYVWDFIRKKYDILRDKYSASISGFSGMIGQATAKFNTQVQLEELEQFVRSTPDLGSGKEAFEAAIAKTKANIRWMAKNYPIVKNWLERQVSQNVHSS